MSCTWLDCTDKGGEKIRVERFDGLLFPPKPIDVTSEKQCHDIRDMEVREDDVFVLSYPKSGTHWTWEVTHMLVTQRAEYHKERMPVFVLDITKKEDLDAMASPRVLGTHFRFRYFPQQVLKKGTKVVMVHRNPKDVAVSTYGMYTGTRTIAMYDGKWDDYFDMWLEGNVPYSSWFDFELEWEKELSAHPEMNVHHVHYEDMKRDPVKSVKGIASFLGRDVSDETCAEIAEACGFNKLRQAYSEFKGEKLRGEWKNGTGIFRKGEVGDWKNWFTVAQSERFDQEYAARMGDSKWTYTYTI
ncbi:sulfotransferase 1C4-like [Haliotis asinina]|uniref:sulfotransferase 1C4-like n=1 Tax=Haliotis asinina TaxID=109174 RepID=UPI003532137F